MKVLVDTNIFLEYLLQRSYFEDTKRLFSALLTHDDIQIVVSDKSILDIHYIAMRATKQPGSSVTTQQVIGFIQLLTEICIIDGGDTNLFTRLLTYKPIKDFEDNFQYQVARKIGCDAIITINKADFVMCDMPVYLPQEFLQKIA